MFLGRFLRTVMAVAICSLLPNQNLFAALASEKASLSLIEADHAEAIYRHLVEKHWVSHTGLFASFPDSTDRRLAQQASTYEQGAMGLLAIRFGDLDRATGLFRFLKDAWFSGPMKTGRQGSHGLPNFFNAEFGTEGLEKTVHVGPNAWAGLFAARLGNATKDPEATQWALDVAYWIANGVPHKNGGVAMGPTDDPQGAAWSKVYSTENNLSYYGLLTELLRTPTLDREQRITVTQERDRVEGWLKNYSVNRNTYELYRGQNEKGMDNVQALDTVTWLVSAVGPRKLAEHGIDPDKLMETAAQKFEVKIADTQGVDPADEEEAEEAYVRDNSSPAQRRPAFAKHRMIWYEGVGQYVLALSAVADYARSQGRAEDAKRYLDKAARFTESLDRASLKHYAKGAAYPYATPGRFFHDGWNSPMPSTNGPASSLIAGVWRCFAGLGMDPLAGRHWDVIQNVRVQTPKNIQVVDRPRGVLFGTSEDMTVQAWRFLDQGNLELAEEQAKATIQEWSMFAKRMQAKKSADVGHVIDYTGLAAEKNKIFSYWALNDVAAAYFILGKTLDLKRDYKNAAQAFQQIVNHYSLAQVWDPRGWFWAPMDAVTNDYVLTDPSHYGIVIPQVLAAEGGAPIGKRPN